MNRHPAREPHGSTTAQGGSAVWLALVVALLILTTACGHDGQNRASRSSLNQHAGADRPCLILKKGEVEAVLGTKIAKGEDSARLNAPPPISVIGMKFCIYRSLKTAGPFVAIGATTAYPSKVFDKYKNSSSRVFTDVPGLGTRAFMDSFGATSSLVVLDADKVVGISLGFVTEDQEKIEKELALKTLSRL